MRFTICFNYTSWNEHSIDNLTCVMWYLKLLKIKFESFLLNLISCQNINKISKKISAVYRSKLWDLKYHFFLIFFRHFVQMKANPQSSSHSLFLIIFKFINSACFFSQSFMQKKKIYVACVKFNLTRLRESEVNRLVWRDGGGRRKFWKFINFFLVNYLHALYPSPGTNRSPSSSV